MFNLIHLITSSIKRIPFVRHSQRRDFSLLTATIFFLAWSHCGESAGAEKQACLYDIILDISINPENEILGLFPEIELPPCHYMIALLEPDLLPGNLFQNHSLPDLHRKNCKSRASPARFPT
jgi:hypothetical protein